MTGPVASRPPQGVVPGAGGSPRGAGAPPGTLLPDPAPLFGAGLDNAMGTLYALISKQNQNGVSAAKSQVDGQKVVRDAHLKAELAAIKREQEADGEGSRGFFASLGHLVSDVADDLVHLRIADAVSDTKDDLGDAVGSPQFWKDLASGAMSVLKGAETLMASAAAFYVAGPAGVAYVLAEPDSPATKACAVAGEAALTAVTCGVAGPVLVASAVGLSAGGYIVSETKCFGDDASKWVGAGMQLTGSVVAAAGGGGANVDSTVTAVLGGQKALTGSATVVAGAAHARLSGFEADARDAEADVTSERLHVEKFACAVRWVIDSVKEDKESHERALSTLQGALDINHQTTMAAGAMTVRG